MQRGRPARVATCGALLAAASLLAGGAHGRAAAPETTDVALAPAFAAAPLEALRVTGGYAEPRSNHFHAGFDFSTGGRTGLAVRAPLASRVERVRASGAGYGRSLYLRAADGRLLVFGHLDAFAPALAAYVDSVQRASGQYEQDLWPATGRFAFAAGETVAWSGESGAGGPHLHLEVRHGDFALHPLRGGLRLPPPAAPRLVSLTLEPLDGEARVAGGVWPRTFPLRAAADTIEVAGRVRALVRSVSGVPGAEDAPAWSTSLTWESETVEARLDSISWAGEMSELDQLLDRGRIAGSRGLLLSAPGGWRPRFLRTSAPLEAAAGVLEVGAGDAPRTLRLAAREPGGIPVERVVVLRPPAGGTKGAAAPLRAPEQIGSEPVWTFAVLPGPRLRVRVSGTPAGLDHATLRCERDGSPARPAQWDGGAWVAVLDPGELPNRAGLRFEARDAAGGAWVHRVPDEVWAAGTDASASPASGVTLRLDPKDVFEEGLVLLRVLPGVDATAQGLAAAGPRLRVRPESLPLRRAVRVALPVDAGVPEAGVGLYRRRAGGAWEWQGATRDAATRTCAGESSFLGEFALLRDTVAPELHVLAPAKRPMGGAYSRWRLVAVVRESGSGIAAASSAFFVDGVRVPTEWDPETRQLRWRPLAPPAPGRHTYELRASDRAGNTATRRGAFVLDSARR